MKIALPSKENIIDSHFGHCDHFTVYTINDKKEIIAEEICLTCRMRMQIEYSLNALFGGCKGDACGQYG